MMNIINAWIWPKTKNINFIKLYATFNNLNRQILTFLGVWGGGGTCRPLSNGREPLILTVMLKSIRPEF